MVETARIRGGCRSLSTHNVLVSDGPKPCDVSAIKQLRLPLSLFLCVTHIQKPQWIWACNFQHSDIYASPIQYSACCSGWVQSWRCSIKIMCIHNWQLRLTEFTECNATASEINSLFLHLLSSDWTHSSSSSSRKKVNQERTLDDSTLCKWLRPQWWLWGNNALDLMKKLLLFKLNKSIIVFVRSQSHETKCLFYMPPRS